MEESKPRVHRSMLGLLVLMVALMGLQANALAAFPGQNGKIAFSRGGDIWTINPDGSGEVNLTNSPADDQNPAWSPDGTKIAFDSGTGCCDTRRIFVMLANGSGVAQISSPDSNDHRDPAWSPDGSKFTMNDAWPFLNVQTMNADGTGGRTIFLGRWGSSNPAWSPDGTKIAFQAEGGCPADIWTIDPNGNNQSGVTHCENSSLSVDPNWSPNGARLAYARAEDCVDSCGGLSYLSTISPDGTNPVTFTEVEASRPAWSPDGTKIAYNTSGPNPQIRIANTDGTNITDLALGTAADWQPIPINSYPRPKGAGPSRFSLVPGYAPCTSSNRQHGPPLAFPSCKPPAPSSPHLTVGSPDVNGGPAGFVGHVLTRVLVGNPATPADEADVVLELSTTDVRCGPTNPPSTCGAPDTNVIPTSDYTGELEGVIFLRITDKDNTPHPGGPGSATVEDFDLRFTVPCTETASDTSIGSSCSVSTTVDALLPGAVKEGRRAIWELDRVHVRDGGPDGDAATAGNRVFLRPGVFDP